MATDPLPTINMMESQFALQSGQRLGFLESKGRFCIIDKDTRKDNDCKTSLRYLCRKVDDLYKSENLTADQALFLKLNVQQVNSLYHKYNQAIYKHRFYNFLDKLVWIITFGSIRLTYSDVNTSFLDFTVNNVVHTMRYDRELYVRMLKFFSADMQRVQLFSQLVKGMVSSADFELNEEGMHLYIKVANTYFGNDEAGRTADSLPNEQIFKLMQHLVANPELMTSSEHFTKKLFNEIAALDFETLETANKEHLIQALEAVQKNDPVRFTNFFVQPKSSMRILEHVEPLAISGSPQIKNSVAAIMPELLKNAVSKFDELTVQEKLRLFAIAADQPNSFLNSISLTPVQRLPMLTEVCSFEGEALWSSPVADPLYRYCLGRYDALSADEKPLFFKLFLAFGNPITLKSSRAIQTDYVNYLIQPKNTGTTDIARMVHSVVEATFATLSDDEKTNYLKFLDIYKLATELNPQRVEEILKYLADHLALIPSVQNLVVQLFIKTRSNDTAETKALIQAHQKSVCECIELTKLGRKEFILFVESPGFKANPEKHLFNLNFSLLAPSQFDKIIGLAAFEANLEKLLPKINFSVLSRNQFDKVLSLPSFAQKAAKFLFKINFATLSRAQFDKIIKMPCLAVKNGVPPAEADIYLATANDEQLELYYGPLERKKYVVNMDHIKKKVDCPQSLAIPPLPIVTNDDPPKPIEPPSIEELLTMFDEINFTKKDEPGYYDRKIEDDTGEIAPSEVKKNLQVFIDKILARRPYTASPEEFLRKSNDNSVLDTTRPNPLFKQFFDEMTLALQHIILALRPKTPDERTAVLIQLGVGGRRCAMRHKRDTFQMLTYLNGTPFDVDENMSVEDMLFTALVRFRKGLLIDAAHKLYDRHSNGDVHWENSIVMHAGPGFGVKEQNTYNDTYDPFGLSTGSAKEESEKRRKEMINSVMGEVNPKYKDPTKLLNLMDRLLNDPKRTQKPDFREIQLMGVIKQKKPPGMEEYDAVEKFTVSHENYVQPNLYPRPGSKRKEVNGFKISREGLIHLAKSFGILVDAPPDAPPPPMPRASERSMWDLFQWR